MAAASRYWPVARLRRRHAAPARADADLAEARGGGRIEEQSSVSQQARDVLLRVLAERTPELEAHVDGVGELAEATARLLGLADQDVRLIRLAAELHDVGKSAIPDSILNKPGPLDETEWDFMRRHTLIGERIVSAAPALAPVAGLVRSSHERLDGHGYPDGIAGEQIPLGARILAVCDAYDAMVSDRPYRKGISRCEAIAELRRCAGTQFDPLVVEAFCLLRDERGAVVRAA